MAVAYESIASVAWQNSANTVISKPSGTADGDVLFAFLAGSRNGGTNPSISSVPSGWTEIHNSTCDTSTGRMVSYYKVASSEGSNWTWTWNSANPDTCGAVIRVSGGINPSVIALATDDGSVDSDSTPTFTGGVTPSAADSLLILAGYSKDAGNAHSSQAITTSNPTWSERLDQSVGVTNSVLSIVTANRTQATATGDFSLTVDSGSASTDAIGHLISISPFVNVTVSPDVMSVVSSVLDVTVTGGATASPDVISVVSSVQAPTVSMPTPDWTNENKNIAICINQDKS